MPSDEPRSNPLATPRAPGALLDYQEGSVVSRTVVKRSGGTVTLFAFDEGEGLSEHSSPHEALVHILEGSAWITVSGEGQRVGAGEALFLPANIPHALRAEERFKMLLVMIRESD